VGVYLIPIDLDLSELDDPNEGGDIVQVHAALLAAGLDGLTSVKGGGDGFEEKLIADISTFDRLCADILPTVHLPQLPAAIGAEPALFPARQADLWLPLPFAGVLTVPGVAGPYSEELTIASAIQIDAQCQALASAVELDWSLLPPLSPRGYVINGWHESLTPSGDSRAAAWQRDPDAAFFIAVYGSAAAYAIRHNTAVGYS
jgi:hypothetical protein